MIHRFLTVCLIACTLLLLTGACSKGTDPAIPETTQNAQAENYAGQMLWGVYDISIDPATGNIETVPIRTPDFTANVVRFLQPPIAPIQLVNIKINPDESKLSEGLAALDITLRHPFPSSPIFRGFDVRGIINIDGEVTGKHGTGVKYPSPTGTRMLNPDGYTRWWNQPEFTSVGTIFGYTEGSYAVKSYTSTATVNPYKLHTKSLDVSQPMYQMDLTQRATFPVIDGFSTRRYKIQFNPSIQPLFRFKYSIAASWSLPNPSYKPYYPIEAYDQNANCQEPYLVKIESYDEIPYYVDQWVSGGNLVFNLTIGDWQATGGNVLDQISHVWIESPTLFENPIDVKNTMEFVESTTPTQATYKITLEDMMPNALEGQQMLITIESANPNTFAPQITGDPTKFKYPADPLASYLVADVPITNLAPQGDYAYVYFIPDWCATMRDQCADDADNQKLLANIMTQNIDGYYNDYTYVQIWEGKTNTQSQDATAFMNNCTSLGYTVSRTANDYFDATGSRVIIAVLFSMGDQPPNPAFTQEEAADIQEFINNGGILFFMCEASVYFNDQGLSDLFDWLGMLMQYGGGATPEMTDGYTTNITFHWLTEDVDLYHYYTCGQWITEDPYVLTLVSTEYDERLILMYPLPLE